MDKFTEELLIYLAEKDLCGLVYWNEELKFHILCNDFFYWASADGEDITSENFPILKQSIEDSNPYDGILLFCSRIRNMRPQGAYYKYLDKQYWHLFDACGPERKAEFGNPENRPEG